METSSLLSTSVVGSTHTASLQSGPMYAPCLCTLAKLLSTTQTRCSGLAGCLWSGVYSNVLFGLQGGQDAYCLDWPPQLFRPSVCNMQQASQSGNLGMQGVVGLAPVQHAQPSGDRVAPPAGGSSSGDGENSRPAPSSSASGGGSGNKQTGTIRYPGYNKNSSLRVRPPRDAESLGNNEAALVTYSDAQVSGRQQMPQSLRHRDDNKHRAFL